LELYLQKRAWGTLDSNQIIEQIKKGMHPPIPETCSFSVIFEIVMKNSYVKEILKKVFSPAPERPEFKVLSLVYRIFSQ
jgi:16S rRNA A1518/A1519 N6-dimethyltransferase RsmA/KsgA/DIM1 with predicted DNA glycosylase/AP lyase activity